MDFEINGTEPSITYSCKSHFRSWKFTCYIMYFRNLGIHVPSTKNIKKTLISFITTQIKLYHHTEKIYLSQLEYIRHVFSGVARACESVIYNFVMLF